jgi:hypothetical protein
MGEVADGAEASSWDPRAASRSALRNLHSRVRWPGRQVLRGWPFGEDNIRAPQITQ